MSWAWPLTALLAVLFPAGASTLMLEATEKRSVTTENSLIELLHGCKCVKHNLCINNTIDVYGFKLLPPRGQTPKITCKGGTFLNEIICCKHNQLNDSKVAQEEVVRSPMEENNFTCGFQNTLSIADERSAPVEGEFPWLAAIYKKTETGSYEFHSSGSLIHPKVVLTAAHAVASNQRDFSVVVNGKVDCALEKSAPEEKRGVSEVIRHPHFNAGSRYNDAALLILDTPLELGPITPARVLCLPPSTIHLEGARCVIAGWGDSRYTRRMRVLRKATVPFVDNDRCEALLKETRLGQGFTLDKSFMCAGGERGIGACTGSGGSPLMCPIPSWSNQYSQVGIVSWSVGCGTRNVPGVYTSVAEISEWIRSELQNRQIKI